MARSGLLFRVVLKFAHTFVEHTNINMVVLECALSVLILWLYSDIW